MCNARTCLLAATLIVAVATLSGCARMKGQSDPWAGATSQQQQKSAYQNSYVDRKVEHQVNRQQSHINQRINRETNQAVDSAVEQALDSIFN